MGSHEPLNCNPATVKIVPCVADRADAQNASETDRRHEAHARKFTAERLSPSAPYRSSAETKSTHCLGLRRAAGVRPQGYGNPK